VPKTELFLKLILSSSLGIPFINFVHIVCRRGSDYDDYEDVGNIVMDGHDHDMPQHHHQTTVETASAGGAATTPQRSPTASGGSNRPAGAGSRGDGTGQGKQSKGATATGVGSQQQSSSGGGRNKGAGGRVDVGVGKGTGGREDGGVGKGTGVVFPEKSVVPTGGIDFSGCEQDPETGGWRRKESGGGIQYIVRDKSSDCTSHLYTVRGQFFSVPNIYTLYSTSFCSDCTSHLYTVQYKLLF
jgi:hypothetical protein